ncbi:MAG: MMPL family transporter [Actinobacteria bacterium]|nr:MMPL family transporter [Actinomycetota bacterium]
MRLKHRKPLALAILATIVWLMISGISGPLFGKLSTVQKNDNSKFLPDGVESNKAAVKIEKFSTGAKDQFPTLVLFLGSVTPEKIASANVFMNSLGAKPLVEKTGELIKDKAGKSVTVSLGDYISKTGQVGAFPSQDGKAILGNLPLDSTKATDLAPNDKPALLSVVASIRYYANQYASSNQFMTHTTGLGGLFADLFGAFGGLDSSLLLTTGGVIALILIVVYRSPVLWILPLLSAMTALTLSGAVIYTLAKHNIITLDGQSQGILSVLVLGAATDYALLLIARYREELHLHESRFDAMKIAWRGVVEPIIASGSTVTLGLLVLLLSELTNNKGLGPVGAIGIVCAMVTILTFLPALLVLFGRWIFWPKKPKFDGHDEKLTGIWSKVAKATAAHPRKYWLISGAALLILAAFATTLGANGLSTVQSFTQRTDAVIGQEQLLKHFPGGQGQPTQIVTKESSAAAMVSAMKATHGVSDASIAGAAIDGDVIVNVTLTDSPDSAKAIDNVPAIRTAAHKTDPTSVVGGTSAVYYDIHQATRHDRNLIIPVILLLIAIILGLLLRSILAAVLLLATVILSFLATLGACALVFHHIFHFAGEDSSFPLFAFVFLVALGIDYNIFLMTRVREETLKLGTREGMIKGVTVTGGVITSAGIVLAATFTVLGILPLVFLAELGFAVSFGVLLDTLIVRSILVPALVHSIGAKTWWPSKLSKTDQGSK